MNNPIPTPEELIAGLQLTLNEPALSDMDGHPTITLTLTNDQCAAIAVAVAVAVANPKAVSKFVEDAPGQVLGSDPVGITYRACQVVGVYSRILHNFYKQRAALKAMYIPDVYISKH